MGRTAAANFRAWASSSSRTAMSAWSRPLTGSSPSIEEMTPRVKLLPVGLVKTSSPWARRMATSILVVVVLPLVPLTTTIPRGTPASAWARKPGPPSRPRGPAAPTPAPEPRRGPGRLACDHGRCRPQHGPTLMRVPSPSARQPRPGSQRAAAGSQRVEPQPGQRLRLAGRCQAARAQVVTGHVVNWSPTGVVQVATSSGVMNGPARLLFEPVVVTAQTHQVGLVGRAVRPWPDVVDVAAAAGTVHPKNRQVPSRVVTNRSSHAGGRYA